MIKVKRANVVLTVEDDERKKFLDLGYDIIENGKVVEKAIPTDMAQLRKHYVESERLVNSLLAEIKSLKVQLKKAKRKNKEEKEEVVEE